MADRCREPRAGRALSLSLVSPLLGRLQTLVGKNSYQLLFLALPSHGFVFHFELLFPMPASGMIIHK
jgi:hypothetical protein